MQIATIASMSSREIADLTGKQHPHVLRDIRAMLAQVHDLTDNPSLDYQQIQGVIVEADEQTKRTSAIHLDKDHTLALLTGYDAKARFRVIKRWQELEAAATRPALPDFTDPVAAARAWANEVEAKRIAETKVIELQPKADFHDRVTQSDDTLTIAQVAKILRAGPNRFFSFLRKEGLLMASNLPYQQFLNRGLFRVVETPYTDHLGRERISIKTVVTQKGLVFIQGLQDKLALYSEVSK